jgi:Ca2+-binding EF-hand superfamily protein
MIEDIFLCYDDDQNGVLSKEEMEEFTASCLQNMENEDQKMLGINLYSPEIFNNFFEKYDQDKNGVIDKDEMLHFLKEVAAASKVRAENVKSQKQNGY